MICLLRQIYLHTIVGDFKKKQKNERQWRWFRKGAYHATLSLLPRTVLTFATANNEAENWLASGNCLSTPVLAKVSFQSLNIHSISCDISNRNFLLGFRVRLFVYPTVEKPFFFLKKPILMWRKNEKCVFRDVYKSLIQVSICKNMLATFLYSFDGARDGDTYGSRKH